MHSDSQLSGPTGFMIEKRPFRNAVQLASIDVGFHLKIPRVPVEVGKPLTQSRQLVRRKLLDLVLDFLYAAHESPGFNGNENLADDF
jgi:hypothetical protein